MSKLGIREDLGDCPFCGCAARSYVEDDDNRWLTFYIRCTNCSAEMSSCCAAGSRTPYNKQGEDRLVVEWNTRLGSSPGESVPIKVDYSMEVLKEQLDKLSTPAKIRHMQEALEKCLSFFKGEASYSIQQLKHFCAHALGKDDREE